MNLGEPYSCFTYFAINIIVARMGGIVEDLIL